ncbi:hypothetical protein L484_015905 [Morus notabilis]|uniref:Uncharacterized protein n=1 Tax=Morus notabilis TaxID=981085 RepID=W9QZN9_9ROSA|nr:hypothetical protein L484_015905 [Morus notabilis]
MKSFLIPQTGTHQNQLRIRKPPGRFQTGTQSKEPTNQWPMANLTDAYRNSHAIANREAFRLLPPARAQKLSYPTIPTSFSPRAFPRSKCSPSTRFRMPLSGIPLSLLLRRLLLAWAQPGPRLA